MEGDLTTEELEHRVFGQPDTIQGAMGFGVGHLQYQGDNEDMRILVDSCKSLDVVFTTDGLIYCKTPVEGVSKMLLMRHTHLRCLLKKEYLQRGGPKRGTKLDRAINTYILAMYKVIQDKWKTNRRKILETASRTEVVGTLAN